MGITIFRLSQCLGLEAPHHHDQKNKYKNREIFKGVRQMQIGLCCHSFLVCPKSTF